MGDGIRLTSRGGGLALFGDRLQAMAARGGRLTEGMAMLGHRIAFTLLPLGIRTNDRGLPSPRAFPRGYRSGGKPLLDTGILIGAFAYVAAGDHVTVGSNRPGIRVLNRGGTIRPRFGKFLLLPLNPPLSRTQVRAFPQGKAAIRGVFPGSFFLVKGPQGPGVYRRRGSGIERIAAARVSVRIPATRVLTFRAAWRADLSKRLMRWYEGGQGQAVPLRAGNPKGKG